MAGATQPNMAGWTGLSPLLKSQAVRPTGDVFVREELQAAVPVAVARERLLTQLRVDGLQAAASTVLEFGGSALPGGGNHVADGSGGRGGMAARPTLRVRVHALPANARGLFTVVPIRWFVDGLGHGQPILDVNVEVGPALTIDTTLLLLIGLYRPLASRVDQGLGEWRADRIPADFLTSVAAVVESERASSHAELSI